MSRRLFCYYGDDFTGSTDALEALAANGVPSVLFLDPPDYDALAPFPDCQAIGVAGESRSRSPEWMSDHLPRIFKSLRDISKLKPPQVCSVPIYPHRMDSRESYRRWPIGRCAVHFRGRKPLPKLMLLI